MRGCCGFHGRAETEAVGAETGGVLQVGGKSRSRGALWAGSGAGAFKPCAPISCVPPLGTSLHSSFLHQLFGTTCLLY